MARTIFKGPVASKTKETDGIIWIPGYVFTFDVGTWTLTRGAVGNYFVRKTAAANVSHPTVDLTRILLQKFGADPNRDVYQPTPPAVVPTSEAHDIRGVQITAFDVVYAIGTAALNAHTAAVSRTVYVNNVAPAVTAPSTLTGSLAVATQAQPYLTALTAATIYTLGNNAVDTGETFELTVDAALTTVYDLYGVFAKYNYNVL